MRQQIQVPAAANGSHKSKPDQTGGSAKNNGTVETEANVAAHVNAAVANHFLFFSASR